MKRLPLITAVILFICITAIYIASPITAHTDSLWSLYLATSLIKTGDLNLDEYSQMIPDNDYRTQRVNDHYYSVYPIGAPLMAVPIVFIVDRFPLLNGENLSAFLASHRPDPDIWRIEKNIASIIVAFNAVLMFVLAMQYLDIFKSLILTVIFSLATSAWSTASRGLWQHGPSMLCLTLALFLMAMARRKPAYAVLTAIPLAFSLVVRPTNSISVAFFTLYVLVVHRRYFLYYLVSLFLCISPFFIYNYSVYQQLLPPYYTNQPFGIPTLAALLGTIASPSRGLLIFSPILLLSLYGFYRRLSSAGKQIYREIDLYLFGIIVAHWLAISAFPVWYGGWTLGPRYFSDVLPYFCFLFIPVLEALPEYTPRRSAAQVSWALLVMVLAAFSIFVQYRCSTHPGPSEWNGKPMDVDQNQLRLWYWGDMQFLRNLCGDDGYQAPKCWLNSIKKIYQPSQTHIDTQGKMIGFIAAPRRSAWPLPV